MTLPRALVAGTCAVSAVEPAFSTVWIRQRVRC